MITDYRQHTGGALGVLSGYRSYQTQQGIWDSFGVAEGITRVAEPGHSEHQTGLTVDLSRGDWFIGGPYEINEPDFYVGAQPALYAWLDANAWRYGFINSYPPSHLDTTSMLSRTAALTGYAMEPWHWRYVGNDVALLHREIKNQLGIHFSAEELMAVIAAEQLCLDQSINRDSLLLAIEYLYPGRVSAPASISRCGLPLTSDIYCDGRVMCSQGDHSRSACEAAGCEYFEQAGRTPSCWPAGTSRSFVFPSAADCAAFDWSVEACEQRFGCNHGLMRSGMIHDRNVFPQLYCNTGCRPQSPQGVVDQTCAAAGALR